MRKLLSILLSVTLIIAICPLGLIKYMISAAATFGTCGDNLTWKYDTETNTLAISGTGTMSDFGCIYYTTAPWRPHYNTIKTVLIENGVTSIGEYAFTGCLEITTITIPDSVTSIGSHAFHGCTELTSITIPDSVTRLGSWVFEYCSGLTSAIIGDSVPLIGFNAFYKCTKLTSVKIGSSVTKIDFDAFSGCTALTSVTIPNSVTSIGGDAFSGCKELTSITIGNSVTFIDQYAFAGCTALEKVNITDVDTWCKINFLTYSSNPLYYAKNLYVNGMLTTNIKIPDSVTSVRSFAFLGCTSITSITIPNSLTSIGYYSFGDCTNLTDVYYTGTEQQRQGIFFDYNNDNLLNATWHYNYVPCKHAETETRNTKSATCTTDGYTGDTYCADCGVLLEQGEVIPALGHKYSWKITKVATLDESGIKEERCSVCGEKTGKAEVLLYTGHVIGDINGDGHPNNKDLVLLFQYLSGWGNEVNKIALDVNGDGKENNQDLVLLFQYLSGWDVEIF